MFTTMGYVPCPRSRLRVWSRELGSAVPSRVSLLILHTHRLNLVLTYGIPLLLPVTVSIRTVMRRRTGPEFITSRLPY